MSKLRKSARWCPQCMSCSLQNPDGNILCLAHSNKLNSGKGMGLKGRDDAGAIVCDTCHKTIDGQIGKLSREDAQAMHARAHERTVAWWIKTGYLPAAETKSPINRDTNHVS